MHVHLHGARRNGERRSIAFANEIADEQQEEGETRVADENGDQEWIDSEPRVTWQAPKGVSVAYIQWDIPMDDEEFCIKLLKEEGVLLVPGNRFELPGGARLGYCAPEPVLREGLARLGRALRQFD